MNAVIQDILVYLCYLIIVVWVAEGPLAPPGPFTRGKRRLLYL